MYHYIRLCMFGIIRLCCEDTTLTGVNTRTDKDQQSRQLKILSRLINFSNELSTLYRFCQLDKLDNLFVSFSIPKLSHIGHLSCKDVLSINRFPPLH